ncbi:MAG: choice-of-anchor I family protein [Dehalococcoidia bacterium]
MIIIGKKLVTFVLFLLFVFSIFFVIFQTDVTSGKTNYNNKQILNTDFDLVRVGNYKTDLFDESAAEIVKFDPITNKLFIVNAQKPGIDVVKISNNGRMSGFAQPVKMEYESTIDLSSLGGTVNSVSIHNGVVAVAVQAQAVDENGVVGFYDTKTLELMNSVEVGVLPDMLTFTPDGKKVITANEGQPNDDYSIDPEGSVSIIDLTNGIDNANHKLVRFGQGSGEDLKKRGVRIYGPSANVAQDFEPEYITVTSDSKKAYVALQENNAFAVYDLEKQTLVEIIPLGTKNHMLPGYGFDASDKDGGINIRNWPTLGYFMPDSIDNYTVDGKTYIVTANEGDTRDYDGYSEEARVSDIMLDSTVFPNAEELQKDENLGRLLTTTANGDTDGDGDHDIIYSIGGRSMSIFDEKGSLIWDSGDQIARMQATLIPEMFNANGEEDSKDSRSDAKGAEPEALKIAKFGNNQWIAFLGLERVGGIMAYNITNPKSPEFLGYTSGRYWDGIAEDGTAGDLAPEGIEYISPSDSPTGRPLLVVANEVSGNTTVWEINFTP